MNADQPVAPRAPDLDANVVDNHRDELQVALAPSRKSKLHKVKKLTSH